MKTVFVAGPFRAAISWEIQQNVTRAEQVALELWRMGLAVLCPHSNCRHFQGAAPDDVWLRGDLEMVSRFDAVVMLPTWEFSEGARGEHAHAIKEGKVVFYWPTDVLKIAKYAEENP